MTDPLLEQLRPRVVERLRAWRPDLRLAGLAPLSGGSSSLTYVVRLERSAGPAEPSGPSGPGDLVLKVAPPGLPPVRNRDVLRQARLMRALAGHGGVRVPALAFEDPGPGPDVPPLLAMELVPGSCEEPVLQPAAERAAPAEVRARAYDAAVALAELHAVDPNRLDLRAEPVTTLGDEIDRWTRAFETVPEDLRGDYETCAELLHDSVPEPLGPVVNHGDYRLGNTLCLGDRVTAIIDWEIWSLGDPRIDVTWLTFFTDESAHPAAEPGAPAGTPTKAELIAAYETESGAPLPDMAWFDVLARYKEAAATALLLKRGRRGGAMPSPMQRMVAGVPRLLDEVRAALS